MGRRSGKKPLSFSKKLRSFKRMELQPMVTATSPIPSAKVVNNHGNLAAEATASVSAGGGAKGVKKKPGGARLWMRFDRRGQSEILECDKSVIIKRAAIPARDLRILGPIFSHSSNILAREKAMVVNLEFIRAIVTAEEVLLLDPLCKEVIPFVDQLRQQLPLKSPVRNNEPGHMEKQGNIHSIDGDLSHLNETDGVERELPFEFQVLEIALEVVCSSLDSRVTDLEREAYPVLDELAKNVSTKNLERVRSLKSNLTRLLARVQKARDEIEHLLDDNEDMAHLYLTRKQIQNQQFEVLMASGASNSIIASGANLARLGSNIQGSASIATTLHSDDVEDLEMLLEAYFMQLDGTRNRLLSVREYIDDTEDYVNIQLDNQRNELIQLQLILTMASFAIAIDTFIVGAFAMNIQCSWYNVNGIFWPFVGGTSSGCFFVFLIIMGYARWKKLLDP
ncbi:putative magnesium transporter MRS2-G [Typha latifolia]|uniref:putative magnesium transporter MRS2-G n=1 Tax=Typha latifolia TaxID=4733 RepID=UPI003C2E6319